MIPFNPEEFKKRLATWVDYETPTGDEERLDSFSSLVCMPFEKAGVCVKKYSLPGGPVIHAWTGIGVKRCVLMGHMDTVFPLGTAEKYDEENGRLYGAGVLDMKSGLAILTEAFLYIKSRLPEGWRLEALINSDEERGSVNSRETLLSVLEGANLVFSFEGSPENCVTVSRKGILTFEIKAKGLAAHTSGGADKSKNAIYLLSRLINDVYENEYSEGVSVNIGVIEGGKATNIVPDTAKVKGEIRAGTKEELIRAEDIIKKQSADRNCGYTRISVRPPMPENKKTNSLFRAISVISPDIIPRNAGGGGDAAFACLSGAYTIDGMGAEGARAHTRREYVTEESIEKRLSLAVKAILKCMNEFETLTETAIRI